MSKFREVRKKAVAVALSLAMVTQFVPMTMVTHAAEIENNTALMDYHYYAGSKKSYGANDNTGYVFGWTTDTSTSLNRAQYTFNFAALPDNKKGDGTDESKEGFTRGYNKALKTVYGTGWWSLGYKFGPISEVEPQNIVYRAPDNVEVLSAGDPGQYTELSSNEANELKNGQVMTVSNPSVPAQKVEVRPSIRSDKGGNFLIVEYKVHNLSDQVVDFNIGNEADTQIYNNDSNVIIVTPQTNSGNKAEGLHFIANMGNTYRYTNLDILTYHPDPEINAGMQKRDDDDPSETRIWSGLYNTTGGVEHKNWMFAKSPAKYDKGDSNGNSRDGAAAFSAYFNLKPHETKIARFAVSMKASVYYVDSTYTGNIRNGFIATPYTNIKDAVEGIKANGPEKAYIYLMSDTEVDSTIEIPSDVDITIETTDYTLPSNFVSNKQITNIPPVRYPVDGARKKITRKAGFNDDMFVLKDGTSTSLTLGDIAIDGGSSATNKGSIVNASKGYVKLKNGVEIKNNFINEGDAAEADKPAIRAKASALEISGDAELTVRKATVTGNKSINGSAINFNGSAFKLQDSKVVVFNNHLADGVRQANVYLDANKIIDIKDDDEQTTSLDGDTKIGVSVKNVPTDDTSEVPVAQVINTAGNFSADKAGTRTLSGTGANTAKVVLKSSTYSYTEKYLLEGRETILKAQVLEQKTAGTGINASPAAINGYKYKRVVLSENSGLTKDDNTGSITGGMPNTDVIITYYYEPDEARYIFDAKGGRAVADITQTPGSTTTMSLPITTKTGYDFVSWNKFTDANNNDEFDTGDTDLGPVTAFDTPVVAGKKHYYAKWAPGTSTFLVRASYRNSNPNLPIEFGTDTSSHQIDTTVTKSKVTIPGYMLDEGRTNAVPNTGTFAAGKASYTVKVAGRDVAVNFVYKVDPSVKFSYKVRHVGPAGEIAPEVSLDKKAEQLITARPVTRYGYDLTDATITVGDVASPNSYTLKASDPQLQGAFDSGKVYTGYMPNQNVTITYTYGSNAQYFINSKFKDTTNNEIVKINSEPKTAASPVNIPMPNVYGYKYNSATADPASVGNFDTNGNLSGGVMPNANVILNYNVDRDPDYWKTMTFRVADAPYNHGSVTGNTTFTFLKDDNSSNANGNAYTFEKIEGKNGIPSVAASPTPYYRFAGWYKDAAATQAVSATDTFGGDTTLYAKFEEDPAYWIDINFAEKEHGRVTGNRTLHTYYDNTWSAISVPSTTPEVNYILEKWTVDDATVTGTTALENGKTYYAHFKKDPAIWGTEVGNFDPVGSIDSNGKGKIRVDGVYKDNVYVVTDNDGKIVDVIKAPDNGTINFENLYPGSKYKVYEGTPDTVASKGADISTVTGTNLSNPKDVTIPAVGNNYSLGYDPINDGKVQIVVDPADPDSDYALVDDAGNIVPYDNSDGGWKHASDPTNPKVVFDNLDPNRTYKVIARKKGDTSKTHTDPEKLEAGVDIITTPGDEFEIPKYIVETKNGVIESVADTTVGGDRYTETKKGDVVKVHAEGLDANGNAFKYWKVMNGHNSGIVGNVNTTDLTFTMEATNIVLKAVYERAATNPQNAIVEEESRGGGIGEFALNPGDIPRLEEELTTDKDRELINTNGAEVLYKIVFNKRDAKQTEKDDVRAASTSGQYHQDAHTAAWALDIFADRYVDGRKVDRATSSDAAVTAVVQLNSRDLDMLDYQIFDVTTPGSPLEVTPNYNPEETAGLFEFNANVNHKYVLVYSRAFKVTFVDNKPALDHEHLNDLSHNFFKRFKVRRGETVADANYSTDYSVVTAYAHGSTPGTLKTPFYDVFGAKYDYQNWSKVDQVFFENTVGNIRAFDETNAIKKSIVLYAAYKSDRPQVDEARVKLTGLVAEAEDFYNNPYITTQDGAELKTAIDNAKEVLARHRGDASGNLRQANYDELQAAFDLLERVLNRLKDAANSRQLNYSGRTGGSSGGGGGSAGRGKGTTQRPFEATAEKTFTLGVNGTWRQDPVTGKFQYLIYGGMPLNNTWGKILHTDENGRQLTDWYFFDNQANMVTGWYRDAKTNRWYYLSTEAGKNNGKMLVGWFKDADNRWYYLDLVSGDMTRGWRQIGDKWYYFANGTTADGRPDGSLYVNTTTPDGYKVNANGEWVQ